MKSILVIGIGLFGRLLIKQLDKAGDEILAIDKSEERLEPVLPFVTNSLIGDSTNEDFIKSIGVGNFDVCIVAIGDNFQASLETTSLLKDYGAKFVVARASRLVHEKFLLRNGADSVVFPEKQLAQWTAVRYSSSTIVDYLDYPGDYSIFEVKIPEEWIGKNLIELEIRSKLRLNILSLRRSGEQIVDFPADTVFSAGDTITVFGADRDLKKHLHLNY